MISGAIGFAPDDIFNVTEGDFVALSLKIFQFQQKNNPVYQSFCQYRSFPTDLLSIPFLPISLFKTHQISCFSPQYEKVFTSSGTTGSVTSKHFVANLSMYEQSFNLGFRMAYGEPDEYAIICLLPAYMERSGSSLIYMAEKLVLQSNNPDSGFFLRAEGNLLDTLIRREKAGQKSILLGVSFALLDFAEKYSLTLNHTIVMDTGGMKGRRQELTRMELHNILKNAFDIAAIHSEYGMTELLSQAYSKADGRYNCPPWMRVMVRDEDDPLLLRTVGAGILCIADLANLYSCSFIETEDVGKVYEDGSFEVLGRLDNSDIRGCSLLIL
jgi:hypothetical protein